MDSLHPPQPLPGDVETPLRGPVIASPRGRFILSKEVVFRGGMLIFEMVRVKVKPLGKL